MVNEFPRQRSNDPEASTGKMPSAESIPKGKELTRKERVARTLAAFVLTGLAIGYGTSHDNPVGSAVQDTLGVGISAVHGVENGINNLFE